MKNMVVSEGDEQVCVSAPLDKEAFATSAIPSEEPHIIFDSVPQPFSSNMINTAGVHVTHTAGTLAWFGSSPARPLAR